MAYIQGEDRKQITLFPEAIYDYVTEENAVRVIVVEAEAGRNLELLWLIQKLKPHFKTIADFRKDNKKAIKII